MSQRLPIWALLFGALFVLSFCGLLGTFDVLILIFLLPVIFDLIFSLLKLLGCRLNRGFLRHNYFVSAPWAVCLLWAFLFLKLGWMVLYSPKRLLQSSQSALEDILQRKNYLIHRIDSPHFGPDSSPFFLTAEFREEWAIGTLSMTAMALTQIAISHPELRGDHRSSVGRFIERMLQTDIRTYEKRYWGEDALDSLSGSNGHIGYLGHLNLMLSLYRALGGDERYERLHADISEALARRILLGTHPLLETFPGQIFLPDNSVVIASLALRVQTKSNKQIEDALHRWITYTKETLLEPETGIIVPWVNSDGTPRGNPRGSYAAWNIFYLLQADLEFAQDQARRIRERLLIQLPFGACGIREYLPGVIGPGDIDSGPVVFGLSTSGTGFGLATAKLLDDSEMTACLLLSAEAVGSTLSFGEERRYLLSPLIGDAILLAMRTATKIQID